MLYSIIIFLYNDDNEYYFVITDETAIKELASSLAVAPQLRQEPTAARVRFLRETFENNEVVQKNPPYHQRYGGFTFFPRGYNLYHRNELFPKYLATILDNQALVVF